MACDFQSLYCGDEGYIVRCKQCGHYQVAFVTTMLTLQDVDFDIFKKQIHYKAIQAYSQVNRDAKIVMVSTPSKDVYLILTPGELHRLHEILEYADNEMKAQELLQLFK